MGNTNQNNQNNRFLKKLLFLGATMFLMLSYLMSQAPLQYVSAADSNINVKVCHTPSIPLIGAPANGIVTKETSVMVQGNAKGGENVFIFRNGSSIGYAVADSGGVFSLSVSLLLGTNQLYAAAKNTCGDSGPNSNVVTIERQHSTTAPTSNPRPRRTVSSVVPGSNSAPSNADETPIQENGKVTTLTILEPVEGQTTSLPSIWLKGRTKANTTIQITVNTKQAGEVISDDTGNFGLSIPLQVGENLVTVTESESEQFSKSVKVKYAPILVSGLTKTRASWLLPAALIIIVVLLGFWLLWRQSMKQRNTTPSRYSTGITYPPDRL